MNLTIMLLVSRRFVTREEIKQRIEGYRDLSAESFERTFERDKDELRALGVPIETGSNDVFFEDEEGYRICRQDFELPEVEFTSDEAAVLALAAQVWQEASANEEVSAALAKLQTVGGAVDGSRLHALVPTIGPRDPAFDILQKALQERREVSFDYREPGQSRRVLPWQLAMRGMAWYLLGYDVEREQARLFKLNRFASLPKLGVKSDYQIPAEEQIADRFGELDDEVTLTLAIREGRAAALRRSGHPIQSDQQLPPGYSAWQVKQRRLGLVSNLASFGADIIVLQPAEIRAQVISHLEGVVAQHRAQLVESPASGSSQ